MFSKIRSFLQRSNGARMAARFLAVVLAVIAFYMRAVALRSDWWSLLALPLFWEVGNFLIQKQKKPPPSEPKP